MHKQDLYMCICGEVLEWGGRPIWGDESSQGFGALLKGTGFQLASLHVPVHTQNRLVQADLEPVILQSSKFLQTELELEYCRHLRQIMIK